mgnify:CR=1 FL=1
MRLDDYIEGLEPDESARRRQLAEEKSYAITEYLEDFQSRFVERREATMPAWADADALEHYYQVMALSRVHESEDGGTLSVGEEVEVLDRRPRDADAASADA